MKGRDGWMNGGMKREMEGERAGGREGQEKERKFGGRRKKGGKKREEGRDGENTLQ